MNLYSVLSVGYDLLDVIWFRDKGLNPRAVIKKIVPNEKCNVLDLCCGTFSNGYSIAKENPQNRIMGIDLSKEMLKGAKRKVHKADLKNVRLRCADATNTKIPKESFDYIIIGLVLHECEPELRGNILKEAHRLLKKDGKLIILEWEKQDRFLRKVKYAPLYLVEILNCKTFKEFYNCDKTKYFKKYGFEMCEVNHCNYSSVMVMKKQ